MKLKMPGGKSAPTDSDAGAPENPYLNAQSVWMERYGTYIQQSYNWRLIAMLEAVALTVAIVGLIYIAGQSKYIPYIVALDKLGIPITVQMAQRASNPDPNFINSEISQWIALSRGVSTDRIAQKAANDTVYGMVQSGSAALGYLNSWYTAAGGVNDPFVRGRKGSVTAQVTTILAESNATYLVDWVETSRDLTGRPVGTQNWEAQIGTAVAPPTDPAAIMKNPVGLYITTLKWFQK